MGDVLIAGQRFMEFFDLRQRIFIYGRMIKFSHTIFALPFALSAVVMAWRDHNVVILDLFWILLAMVGARSAAMGFNRIADSDIDAQNRCFFPIPRKLMNFAH